MNFEEAFVKGWGRAPNPSERDGFGRLSKIFPTHEYDELVLISLVLFEIHREQFSELARSTIQESFPPAASQCVVESVNATIRHGLEQIAPQSASATRRALAAELKESLLRVEATARVRSLEDRKLPLVETWIGYSLVLGVICREMGYRWQTGLVFAVVTGGLVVCSSLVRWASRTGDPLPRPRAGRTSSSPSPTRTSGHG